MILLPTSGPLCACGISWGGNLHGQLHVFHWSSSTSLCSVSHMHLKTVHRTLIWQECRELWTYPRAPALNSLVSILLSKCVILLPDRQPGQFSCSLDLLKKPLPSRIRTYRETTSSRRGRPVGEPVGSYLLF